MLRRYGIQPQVWINVGLPLCLALFLLVLAAMSMPGGMAYKPVRKDPPWPVPCPMPANDLLCGYWLT